jgi:hypothetical protein
MEMHQDGILPVAPANRGAPACPARQWVSEECCTGIGAILTGLAPAAQIEPANFPME